MATENEMQRKRDRLTEAMRREVETFDRIVKGHRPPAKEEVPVEITITGPGATILCAWVPVVFLALAFGAGYLMSTTVS